MKIALLFMFTYVVLPIVKGQNGTVTNKYLLDNVLTEYERIIMEDAVENQEIDQLEQIISQRTNKNPCIDTNCSRTVLLHVANYGYLDGYKLVSEMAGTRNPSNSAGITPLKLAVKMGHLDIVKYIIDDAGRNHANFKDHFGETPLHYAVEINFRNLEMVEYLMTYFAPDQPNNAGITCLHMASIYDDLELFDLLARKTSNLYVKNYQNESPLDIAAHSDNWRIVKYILVKTYLNPALYYNLTEDIIGYDLTKNALRSAGKRGDQPKMFIELLMNLVGINFMSQSPYHKVKEMESDFHPNIVRHLAIFHATQFGHHQDFFHAKVLPSVVGPFFKLFQNIYKILMDELIQHDDQEDANFSQLLRNYLLDIPEVFETRSIELNKLLFHLDNLLEVHEAKANIIIWKMLMTASSSKKYSKVSDYINSVDIKEIAENEREPAFQIYFNLMVDKGFECVVNLLNVFTEVYRNDKKKLLYFYELQAKLLKFTEVQFINEKMWNPINTLDQVFFRVNVMFGINNAEESWLDQNDQFKLLYLTLIITLLCLVPGLVKIFRN